MIVIGHQAVGDDDEWNFSQQAFYLLQQVDVVVVRREDAFTVTATVVDVIVMPCDEPVSSVRHLALPLTSPRAPSSRGGYMSHQL